MSKNSQRTRKYQQLTRTVAASIDQQGPSVASKAAQVHPELNAQFMSNAFKTLSKLLSRMAQDLTIAEQAYQLEQADDGPARKRRDQAIEAAAATVLKVRGAVEKSMGKPALATYGLDGETSREGNALLAKARKVTQLMTARPAKMEDEFGGSFDTTVAVQRLQPLVEELAASLDGVAAEARKLQQAMALKNKAATAWDEAYAGVTQVSAGLFRLAGAKDLGDRLRPKGPKPVVEVATAATVAQEAEAEVRIEG